MSAFKVPVSFASLVVTVLVASVLGAASVAWESARRADGADVPLPRSVATFTETVEVVAPREVVAPQEVVAASTPLPRSVVTFVETVEVVAPREAGAALVSAMGAQLSRVVVRWRSATHARRPS